MVLPKLQIRLPRLSAQIRVSAVLDLPQRDAFDLRQLPQRVRVLANIGDERFAMAGITAESQLNEAKTRSAPVLRSKARVRNVAIISSDRPLANLIAALLDTDWGDCDCTAQLPDAITQATLESASCVVYLPSLQRGTVPDLVEAGNILQACKQYAVDRIILVASAAIYGASFRNPGLMQESYPLANGGRTAGEWRKLEEAAKSLFPSENQLVILRCATVLSQSSATPIVRCLTKKIAIAMPGHDPSMQLLDISDLAHAVCCVLREDVRGTFNVAPDGVIPLRAVLRQAGVRCVPIPRTLLRAANAARDGRSNDYEQYARYSWTVSNESLAKLGFRPARSSAEAASEFCRSCSNPITGLQTKSADFDDFGMDKAYIDRYSRTLFRFLSDWYWRIEVAGTEYIPRQGRAVLAGIHRGFMPWDGVMALHTVLRSTGRYTRFLIHPGLVKFPFLANFMTKLGGIVACQKNASYVLERDELLGVFPEGIHGAFVRYSDAYRLHDFHRDAFVKMALRHRAPIVPFVTVGSAEIFPILAKIKSRRWTKYSEWPAFPITPTFPLIPLPLPSKWHTRFLLPIHLEKEYPPSAAADTALVRRISHEVKERMQEAIDDMLSRRQSIFFGSIFQLEMTSSR